MEGNNKQTQVVIQTEYDRIISSFKEKGDGSYREYTARETFDVIVEVNTGIEDFLHSQKDNEKHSEEELGSIVLNA